MWAYVTAGCSNPGWGLLPGREASFHLNILFSTIESLLRRGTTVIVCICCTLVVNEAHCYLCLAPLRGSRRSCRTEPPPGGNVSVARAAREKSTLIGVGACSSAGYSFAGRPGQARPTAIGVGSARCPPSLAPLPFPYVFTPTPVAETGAIPLAFLPQLGPFLC